MTNFTDDRRRHVRIIGPFDGVRPGLYDMPVQIYDLSVGGCFINSVHEAPHRGQIFAIQVGLPTGETIIAKGETAFVRPGFGYGVKFCELSDDNRKRLETALESMQPSVVAQE
ncbi:MAG TPA: PilZ domain-containing protein [Vicinamibacterales bacterium]